MRRWWVGWWMGWGVEGCATESTTTPIPHRASPVWFIGPAADIPSTVPLLFGAVSSFNVLDSARTLLTDKLTNANNLSFASQWPTQSRRRELQPVHPSRDSAARAGRPRGCRRAERYGVPKTSPKNRIPSQQTPWIPQKQNPKKRFLRSKMRLARSTIFSLCCGSCGQSVAVR